ncbi:hypothetical protein T484DRAFT_1646379, partial [Baffinella frigidus]
TRNPTPQSPNPNPQNPNPKPLNPKPTPYPRAREARPQGLGLGRHVLALSELIWSPQKRGDRKSISLLS